MDTIIWIIAFLLAPGLFLMMTLFPEYAAAVIGAQFSRVPASYVDDLLGWLSAMVRPVP